MQRYEKFWKVGRILQGKFVSHHRWREFVSPAEIAEMAEILEPSQMAIYMESPEGEKLYKNIFKIEQNRRGHHRWRIKVTRKTQKAQKLSHHRWWDMGVAALKITKKLFKKLFKIFRAITDG